MLCVGEAWGSMCCPDADHKDRKEEKRPNPKAAGSRIMRQQITVNFRTGMRGLSTRKRVRLRYGGVRRNILA